MRPLFKSNLLLAILIFSTMLSFGQNTILKNLTFENTENNVLYVGIVNKFKFNKSGETFKHITSSDAKISIQNDTIFIIVTKVGTIKFIIKTNKQ